MAPGTRGHAERIAAHARAATHSVCKPPQIWIDNRYAPPIGGVLAGALSESRSVEVMRGQPNRSRFAAARRSKNPHAAALGRLGGLKGGRARAQALTPEQRRKIAQAAAKARWRKAKT